MNSCAVRSELVTALDWYVDQGVTALLADEACDHMVPEIQESPVVSASPDSVSDQPVDLARSVGFSDESKPAFLGKSDAYEEAVKLARGAEDLEALEKAIADFDGIALKKTATNMVFSDGNPKARVMVIGEAPGADEDRLGKPFVGEAGHLLDKILACIGLDRHAEEVENSVYLSNILNWRPPGNRTPAPAEVEVSLPFIERHIQLVQPQFLIFCGGVAAKSLLGSEASISRLRKSWHDYKPQTTALCDDTKEPIFALATYHPSYLLRTPLQKRAVWADMLMLQNRICDD